MKLLASYNIFSGLELMQHSINSIRDSVDHINIVYQTVSNTGQKKDITAQMKSLKGVDSFIEFKPNLNIHPKANETRKRNIGLEYARDNGYSHFISMDADECYEKDQFNKAKELIEKENYDSSACKMQTYYHSPIYRLVPPEEYYVPFIYKVDDRRFYFQKWPVTVDPSRMLEPLNIKLFDRSELEMHHYSYVRLDIREKLNNASSSVNYKARIEDIAIWYETWSYPIKAYLGGKEEVFSSVQKTNNKFNIDVTGDSN